MSPKKITGLLCALVLGLFPYTVSAQCGGLFVDAGEDVYTCFPSGPVPLNGSISGGYIGFEWTPTVGLVGANTLTPFATVQQTTTYTLTAQAFDPNQNLIFNGDFEAGNFGFTSDYIYSPGDLWPEGVYDVLPDPSTAHANFAACNDHTSGSGNMMAVNGSAFPNENVWCQTVAVQPNTQYAFSAWVASLVSAAPAVLQFSINGVPIGGLFSPPATTCAWTNFYEVWDSGNNTSATICIVNQNTIPSGNDFALDDITFSPICEAEDSVTVHVISINAMADPLYILPCEGSETTLSGLGSSVGPNVFYQWETPNGNIVSGGNTLEPVVNMPGTYTLNVIFDNGFVTCTKQATVNVIVTPNPLTAWILPPPPLGCGSDEVLLIGGSSQPGFSSYQWTTNDGNIVSGANLNIATVDESGTYYLLVTNTATGCTAEADVFVDEETDPPLAVAAAPEPIDCIDTLSLLSGTGSSSGSEIEYQWNAENGGVVVSGQDSVEAVAGAPGVYILTVTDTGNGCTSADTITVAADNMAPGIILQEPDTLDCITDSLLIQSNLTPNSVVPVWTAGNGGNIVSGDSSASPLINASGDYFLIVTDTLNGCISMDTVTVFQDTIHPLAVVEEPDTITCASPSINLSGAGSTIGPDVVYQWTAGNGGNIVNGDTTLNPLVNAAGLYTLLVSNTSNGCTAQASLTTTADTNAVLAVANSPDSLKCIVSEVEINGQGSTNDSTIIYLWSTIDGQLNGPSDSIIAVASQPGTYSLANYQYR